MSKADVIELEGIVTEKLPNTMFKVKLENGAIILAHISGKLLMNNVPTGQYPGLSEHRILMERVYSARVAGILACSGGTL